MCDGRIGLSPALLLFVWVCATEGKPSHTHRFDLFRLEPASIADCRSNVQAPYPPLSLKKALYQYLHPHHRRAGRLKRPVHAQRSRLQLSGRLRIHPRLSCKWRNSIPIVPIVSCCVLPNRTTRRSSVPRRAVRAPADQRRPRRRPDRRGLPLPERAPLPKLQLHRHPLQPLVEREGPGATAAEGIRRAPPSRCKRSARLRTRSLW